MKNRFWMFATLMMVVAMLLAACQPQATTTATEPPVVEDTPMEEPTAETPMEETPMEETPMEETPMEETGEIDCMGAAAGDTITMLYQWSGEEETKLNTVLQPLVDACGIVVEPESTRDQALLDTRVQAGTPPDIAFWNITQLVQYQDSLVPMDTLGVHTDSYADFLVDQGTVGGNWLGLPVKADIKTIIWYSPVVFEAKGYAVPTTWEELDALVEEMVANGDVPWAMGFESGDATGWTGTDFIQDIMLVTQGPEFVNGIISGDVSYDDPGVQEAYEIYGKWATDPAYSVGGAQGTLSTGFNPAILQVFSDPPEAMMVKQSGFAAGTITAEYPDLVYGEDFDFFGVPGAQGVQGGADWMMSFSDSNAVKALVAYLSSPLGGQNWAAASFALSPNAGAVGTYTDPALLKMGDILANAQGFTADLGDSIPGGFGSAEFSAVTNFVNGQDLATELANVATAQAEALSQ